MNTSTTLQHDVEEELRWDPSINAEKIGVTVLDQVVQLNGCVGSLYEKWAAESAALRVNAVKAVANEIEVQLTPADGRSDAEIAQAAISQLQWTSSVPDTVKVKVSNGWVTFEGTVSGQYQSDEAERVLRSLKGVKGVTNEITLKPAVVRVEDIRRRLVEAFRRNAIVDANNVQIEAADGKLTLRGVVGTWAERKEAIRTAWSTSGVTQVEDLLLIKSL